MLTVDTDVWLYTTTLTAAIITTGAVIGRLVVATHAASSGRRVAVYLCKDTTYTLLQIFVRSFEESLSAMNSSLPKRSFCRMLNVLFEVEMMQHYIMLSMDSMSIRAGLN